jgi:hypothetical protein
MSIPVDIIDQTCAIFFLAYKSPKEHIQQKISRVPENTREQVASLASRHGQNTVHAAFFLQNSDHQEF